MKTTSVSTLALSQTLRSTIQRMQAELQKAQTEASTGQVSDVGLALGSRSSKVVSFTRDVARMEGIIDSNSLISARLTQTQNSLSQLTTAGQTFLSTLTSSTSGDSTTGDVTKAAANTMLSSLSTILNTSFNGEYIFAGINTDVKPIADYQATGSTAKAAFDSAFQSYFGFAQDDTQASSITSDQMNAFMTSLESDYTGANWSANWSSATDETIVTRINLTETAQTSVSANNTPMQKMALAASLVYEASNGNFSTAAKDAVNTKAAALMQEAISGIATIQGSTGVVEKRITDASDRLQTQVDLFTKQIGNLTTVDPYEASTRVNNLLTQIETSYALTSRMQQVSLLRYLS